MTSTKRNYLLSLTPRALQVLTDQSWGALRAALPYRTTDLRARHVIRCNIVMLRDIASL